MSSPLETARGVAVEVAEGIYRIREADVKDIILFGSVAKGSPNPGDVDLLVIYNGRLPEVPAGYGGRKKATEQILYAAGFQHREFDLPVDVQTLPTGFFGNFPDFYKYIRAGRNPFFYREVFDNGLLFDPSARGWTRPSIGKYRPARDAVDAYVKLMLQFPEFVTFDPETLKELGFPAEIDSSYFLYGKVFGPDANAALQRRVL